VTVTIVNGHRVCQAEAVFRRRPLYLFADLAHAGYVHPLKWSNDFVWFSTDDEAGEIMRGGIPSDTPWGEVQSLRLSAPGIVEYETPSHGGFWVRPDLAERITKRFEFTPTIGATWWEEDCHAALVVLAIPHAFPRAAVRSAARFVNSWRKDDAAVWAARWMVDFPAYAKLWRNTSARASAHWDWINHLDGPRYARAARLWAHLSRGRRLRGVSAYDGRWTLNFVEAGAR
jgi:hypothetical protein